MTVAETRRLLVQARGEPSPVYESYEYGYGPYEDWTHDDHIDTFTGHVPLDEPELGLPEDLAETLRSWSLSRPPEGSDSRAELTEHARQGAAVAHRLARHLGPSAAVRYWDEQHSTSYGICWGCDRPHAEGDGHGRPPHPVHIEVDGEYRFGPLRSHGFGDFFPDDPAAALHLSDELNTALYAWAGRINTTLDLLIRDRDEAKYDDEWQRLFREGRDLARLAAHEIGPARTVTYKGLAHGGPTVLTSVTWQGDREL
ncbi:hypothetical protein [Streptomyces sp. SAS_270]|uniref:hypothetical protein n=1 Tax=Streptomyces sp. SAS_270 TaxID=3412748 RepID=UPI00403C8546